VREGRHEGVLDRPLPALPLHHLDQQSEDHAQVTPDERADQEQLVALLTSILAPDAAKPLAMKTIESVLASVQTNQASSHQM